MEPSTRAQRQRHRSGKLGVTQWSASTGSDAKCGLTRRSRRRATAWAREAQLFFMRLAGPCRGVRLTSNVRRHPGELRRCFRIDPGSSIVIHVGCLCGAVQFEIQEPLEHQPEACHCSHCRIHTGNYWTGINVRRTSLEVRGAELVRWYQSSEEVQRGSCSVCGSTLFWNPTIEGYQWTAVAMGCIDTHGRTDRTVRLGLHLPKAQGRRSRDSSSWATRVHTERSRRPSVHARG